MPGTAPRKAFVLAAGFGTRMLPLSRSLPKPLMPLWGKPMLAHTLELLRRWGVRDVVINCHHRPDDILHFVLEHERMGLRIALSHEPDILGTGGAIRRAQWFLDEDPFWLINADIAADLDPTPLLALYRKARPLAALWLHPERGPRTVEMKNGRIVSFRADPSDLSDQSDRARRRHTFCGLHLLSPRILRFLPEAGFAGIIEAYEKAMAAGERVLGACVGRSYWADVGSPEQYLEAHREILERHRARQPGGRLLSAAALTRMKGLSRHGARIEGFAALGDNVEVARGARIENAVVWNGAHIGAGARVRSAVVGLDTRVGGPVSHVALRAEDALEDHERRALDKAGWSDAATTVEVLAARGSARSFLRLIGPRRTAMLVRYSLDRKENALYVPHARFLASLGVPVPRVLLDVPEHRFAVIEDLGDEHLSGVATHRAGTAYRRVLDQVLLLHARGTREARRRRLRLMPPFSARLYRYERNLFAGEFLRGHLHLDAGTVRGIVADLERVARRLGRATPVLIHRDLQSSNILLRGGRPFFIDFQGMRLGPAAYDLASLLADPYVMLPAALQEELLGYYADRCGDARVRELFWHAAIERLAQALGAFARLGRLPCADRFLDHIPGALAMMARAVGHVDGLAHLEAFARRSGRIAAARRRA